MSASKDVRWVRLGDYIEKSNKKNSSGIYSIDDVRGISIEKKLINTKANLDGVPLTSYRIIEPNEFGFVTVTSRNGEKITITINSDTRSYLVSSFYVIFRIKDTSILDPQFLYLWFLRSEFDRYSRINSWGSAREYFWYEDICRTQIPLPPIEVQRELVCVYSGLKSLAEENEALLQPLSDACHAFIIDCKKKYPAVKLGGYIEEYDKKNTGNKIKEVRSVSVCKDFRLTNAKVNKNELSGYKLVPPKHIAYVQTTKNEKCFAHALNNTEQTFVVSSVDKVIRSKDESVLNIAFLSLFLRRKEFDRYAIFNSWGSAREVFAYSDLCEVEIPLPPLEVQQKVVDLYNSYEEAKSIAENAREQLKTICPALVQKAAHTA